MAKTVVMVDVDSLGKVIYAFPVPPVYDVTDNPDVRIFPLADHLERDGSCRGREVGTPECIAAGGRTLVAHGPLKPGLDELAPEDGHEVPAIAELVLGVQCLIGDPRPLSASAVPPYEGRDRPAEDVALAYGPACRIGRAAELEPAAGEVRPYGTQRRNGGRPANASAVPEAPPQGQDAVGEYATGVVAVAVPT